MGKYKGVHQRKNGTWYYRIKKIVTQGEEPTYFQQSGFATEEDANNARLSKLHLEMFSSAGWCGEVASQTGKSFGAFFQDFIKDCKSETSTVKYTSLYNAQLSIWANRDIYTISDSDIDVLLLKLSLQGYKESYISSIRKVIKKFYRYAHNIDKAVSGDIAQIQIAKPYKLRVLSLFSGIGAPERALKELGVDYELVNFCEIDKKASRAYCLLHGVDPNKNLKDVNIIDADYCRYNLPNFDIMIFGFPCQDISSDGDKEGIMKNGGKHPSNLSLFFNEIGELTRSGLFYKALQIALWKKPKFMIAENVGRLVGKGLQSDFRAMVRNLQDAGYNIYFKKLNSRDYGVPQNRPRVFMIMIRDDLNIQFTFPEPKPKTTIKENWLIDDEWIVDGVADEYYLDMSKTTQLVQKLKSGYDFKHYNAEKEEGYIHCLLTSCGRRTNSKQPFVRDSKGIRCLTSEELMKFQGFLPEDGALLRKKGFSMDEVGHMVGNSITVPVIKLILEQFIEGLSNQIATQVIPTKIVEARTDDKYIESLFAYMGNKSKLMPYLGYLFPANLNDMTFVDLFGGSATVAVNVKADRVIINELDNFLIGTYRALATTPPEKAWEQVMSIVEKYNLTSEDKEAYWKCREDYNKISLADREQYWYWGLALVYHSFNRSHVAYNLNHEFNSSFGEEKVDLRISKERFFPFAKKLYQGSFEFLCQSYKDFSTTDKKLDEHYFFYVDPPYLISEAPYNKFWTEQDEHELYAFLDNATCEGVKWMLSNVLENKGLKNEILFAWLKENQYKYHIYYMKRDYSNSTYISKDTGDTLEIVVVNYNDR